MNILKEKLRNNNYANRGLILKLLSSLITSNNISDTIELYKHISVSVSDSDINNLNKIIFNAEQDIIYSNDDKFIIISNVGIEIIKKFIVFSQTLSVKKNYLNEKIEITIQEIESRKNYINFIQNEFSAFHIDHKFTKQFLQQETIDNLTNLVINTDYIDNIEIKNLLDKSTDKNQKIVSYPIFSLLSYLSGEEAISTLKIWLDKNIITKENFKQDLISTNLATTLEHNVIIQLINNKKWKEVLDIMYFMDIKFKDFPLLLSKIDNVDIIKNIIEKENINPYEQFTFEYIGHRKTTITSSLHFLISESPLEKKQEILEMFSKNTLGTTDNHEHIKAVEFLNLMRGGATISQLKDFMKNRELEFHSLINVKVNNKDIVDIVQDSLNWWIISHLVKAESKMLKNGESTPSIFARFLHFNKDIKYSKIFFTHLNKSITYENLALNYNNIKDIFSKSFSNNELQISIPLMFISNPSIKNEDKNLFKTISSFFENDYKLEFNNILNQNKKLKIGNSFNHSSLFFSEDQTANQYYFLLMYCLKNKIGKSDEFITDIEKINSLEFHQFNLIDAKKLHQLLSDYYFGSQIFPVSIENGEKMETKIMDILSSMIYSLYKTNSNNEHIAINVLEAVTYTLDTLYKNTQNIDKLEYNMIKSDLFSDQLLNFAEILKTHKLTYNTHLEEYKNKLVEMSTDLYHKNIEFNTSQNHIKVKVKKF